MRHPTTLSICIAFASAGLIAGCASSPITSQQQALVRAEAAIQEAEESGAYEHGGAELESARDKLAAARVAAEDNDESRAERLATEAALDAELAAAIASNQEMQSAVDELNATIATLRQELSRSQ